MPLLHLKSRLCSVIVLLFGSGAFAATFDMDFPVKLNGVEVAQVTAAVDGMRLDAIAANELKQNLARWLSAPLLAWLAERGSDMISVDELRQQGIDLQMGAS